MILREFSIVFLPIPNVYGQHLKAIHEKDTIKLFIQYTGVFIIKTEKYKHFSLSNIYQSITVEQRNNLYLLV